MTFIHKIDRKPIDVLYEIIGGEDRRNAPEGLAELYDDLCDKREWVDKFNSLVEECFQCPTTVEDVGNFLKGHYRELSHDIFGRKGAETDKNAHYCHLLEITPEYLVQYIVDLDAEGPISQDYIRPVAEKYVEEIARDIYETADHLEWGDDDVRLAFGRVLCSKLGISV